MMLSCSVFAQNSDSSRIYYQQAFDEIKAMLEGKTEPSFKRAVFVTENAYFDNSLSYEQFNEQIDFLAYLSKRVMANNTLEYDERDKEEVVKKFAAYRVLKDTITFIYKETADSTYAFQTIPYTYDFDDFWGERDWSKMFVTKLLKTRTGNCHSLPFLYKILAEELGTTAYLSMAPNHTFIRQWTKKTGWFNTELTSGQFPIDGWIMASGYIKVDAVVNGIYMDTLSMKQSLAVNLTDLAQGYQKKFGEPDSAFILQCLELALKHYPHYVNALIMQAELYKKKYEALMAKHGVAHASELWHLPKAKALFDDMQSQYLHIHNLGYSKMPKEMYLNWLMDIKERDTNKEVERYTFTPPQPFEKYGYKVKVATASNGKYQEFFDLDTLVQIGTVMLNRMTGQVTSFVEYDTVYSEATLEPEVISRWLSPDPLAEEFYDWSPYNYAFSNPIRYTDPTGLAPFDIIFNNSNGEELGRIVLPGEDVHVEVETTMKVDEPIVVDPGIISADLGFEPDAVGISIDYSGVVGGGLTGGIDFTYMLSGEDAGNLYGFKKIGGGVGLDGEIGVSGFAAKFNSEANTEFFSAKGMEGKYSGYSAGFYASGSYSWSNEDNQVEFYPGQKSTTTWETYNLGGGIGGEVGAKWYSGTSTLINGGRPISINPNLR